MIKKLNSGRALRGWIYMPKWYKTSSDYTKINLQAIDISIMLRELRSRLVFTYIRLQHAIRFHDSNKTRAELKFQKRILDEHLNQIDKLLKENGELQNWSFKKEHGEGPYDLS